jgi:uncharacterized membrane protein YjjB (DUF3815 family)
MCNEVVLIFLKKLLLYFIQQKTSKFLRILLLIAMKLRYHLNTVGIIFQTVSKNFCGAMALSVVFHILSIRWQISVHNDFLASNAALVILKNE